MKKRDLVPLEDDLVELLERERDAEVPAGAADRVFSRVTRSVGLGGPPGSGSGESGSGTTGGHGSPGGTSSTPWLAKPLFTAALGLFVGAGIGSAVTFSILRNGAPPTPMAAVTPRPSVVAEATPPPSAPAPEPEARVAARPPASVASAPAIVRSAVPSDGQSFGAERLVLEAARTAVTRGNGSAALEAIARHERLFPRGKLAQERDGLRIQALLLVGRRAEAQARATQFKQQYPKSFLLPAIEQALEH